MRTLKILLRAAPWMSAAAVVLLAASPANAHAKLESATPAADSTVSAPKVIQVHFSEAVESKLSSLKLATSDGSAIASMAMNDAKDPAALAIMPTATLAPGRYTVTWSVVSDDGHKTHGTFSFTIQ